VNSIKSKIGDVFELATAQFIDNSAILTVVELRKQLPWEIQRVFFLQSSEDAKRGKHAHRSCNQAFLSLCESSVLTLKDGISQTTVELENSNIIKLVPAGIWVEVDLRNGSCLAVFTDQTYDENDYIRDWNEFLEFKGVK
jgi:hypothetical protein